MKLAAVMILLAATARAECVGRASETMRGWKSIADWTLPGDAFGVSYLCSPQNQSRKIVVERFARYVSDVTLPKLNNGEMLIEGTACTHDGAADPFVIPFGNFTKRGVHVEHAWRIEVPSGRIVTIDAKTVRCATPN